MQFRVIVVTDPQTNKQTQPQTHTQDRLQYTAPQLARSVTKNTKHKIVSLQFVKNLTKYYGSIIHNTIYIYFAQSK